MIDVFVRDRKGEHIHSGQRPCEDGGKDWNYASTSQGMPGTTRSQERQVNISPLERAEKSWFS